MKQLLTCILYRSVVITQTSGWLGGLITKAYQRRIVKFEIRRYANRLIVTQP